MKKLYPTRRQVLAGFGGLAAVSQFPLLTSKALAAAMPIVTRPIPSSGETIPIVGLGSFLTMNVGADARKRAARLKLMERFFSNGGGLVDSSPMYGSSEEVIGHTLSNTNDQTGLFTATKVWTPGQRFGIRQMNKSFRLWGIQKFDLMQIHNLVDWETHLETLTDWKRQGRLRYIGITTSHGRKHREFERVMTNHQLDFVQFTYNIIDREAEDRLLPLAAERGQAVIINRPYQRASLFRRFGRFPLPDWAGEFNAASWAQFFLKFVLSHPNVTLAIPATTRLDHLAENMNAGRGPLPDAAMRKRMIDYVERL